MPLLKTTDSSLLSSRFLSFSSRSFSRGVSLSITPSFISLFFKACSTFPIPGAPERRSLTLPLILLSSFCTFQSSLMFLRPYSFIKALSAFILAKFHISFGLSNFFLFLLGAPKQSLHYFFSVFEAGAEPGFCACFFVTPTVAPVLPVDLVCCPRTFWPY